MFIRRKRKKQERDKFDGVHSSLSFKLALNHTKQMIGYSNTAEERLSVIEYVMDVIKKDIEVDALSRYLYNKPFYYKDENYFLFPSHCYTKEGNEIYLIDDGEITTVSLADSCIVSYVSKLDSIWNSIVKFKGKFTYQENNHIANYYKEVDICYVWNGLHSVSMGSYRKQGEIKANQISLTKAFDHLVTDGENWINAHTGKVIMEVHDFRIAILYELAKKKYELK